MQGMLADGAQVSCGAQLKLLSGERCERPCDVILVRFPAGVERREREVVFSRQRVYSFLLLFSQTSTKSGEKLSYYRIARKAEVSEDHSGPSFSEKHITKPSPNA